MSLPPPPPPLPPSSQPFGKLGELSAEEDTWEPPTFNKVSKRLNEGTDKISNAIHSVGTQQMKLIFGILIVAVLIILMMVFFPNMWITPAKGKVSETIPAKS